MPTITWDGCPHTAEVGHNLCLFHLPIGEKRKKPDLAERFRDGFIELYQKGEGLFAGFEFPQDTNLSRLDFRSTHEQKGQVTQDREEPHTYSFFEAHFDDRSIFRGVIFGKHVSFERAIFQDAACFEDAVFKGPARFDFAEFKNRTNFTKTVFNEDASFYNSQFGESTDFRFAKFMRTTNFEEATFGDKGYLGHNKFKGKTSFYNVVFGHHTMIYEGTFEKEVTFELSVFGEKVRFAKTSFNGPSLFSHSTFGDEAIFFHNTFSCEVDFEYTKGRTAAYVSPRSGLRTMAADQYKLCPPGLVFDSNKFESNAKFSKINLTRTEFQHVNLTNLSFLHSDISKTKFIACEWGEGFENKKLTEREGETKNPFRFKRPRLLRDELDWRKVIKEEKPVRDDPTAGDIEVLALQLKQSLEATRDPIAAGDFHFAAMEMKRERAIKDGRLGRRWSLWWYKMLNGYGERWGRAFLWVTLTLLLFTGINYLFNGLYPSEKLLGVEANEIKSTVREYLKDVDWWPRLRHSAAYALQNLLPFKINSGFLRVTGEWVQFLAVVETVVGTTLFTFFVLALRRRFKR